MIDKDMPCRRECPYRTAECKKTCSKWAKWEAKKATIYAARLQKKQSNPSNARMRKNITKNQINAMCGRKR